MILLIYYRVHVRIMETHDFNKSWLWFASSNYLTYGNAYKNKKKLRKHMILLSR